MSGEKWFRRGKTKNKIIFFCSGARGTVFFVFSQNQSLRDFCFFERGGESKEFFFTAKKKFVFLCRAQSEQKVYFISSIENDFCCIPGNERRRGGIIFFLCQSPKINFLQRVTIVFKKSFFVSFKIEFHFFLQNNFLFFSAVQKKNAEGIIIFSARESRKQKKNCCFAWKQMIPGRHRPEKIWVLKNFARQRKEATPAVMFFLIAKLRHQNLFSPPSKIILRDIKFFVSWEGNHFLLRTQKWIVKTKFDFALSKNLLLFFKRDK